MIISFFRIWTYLPTKVPSNRDMRFFILLPSSKTSPEDIWIQSLITNIFSINPPLYQSNHHKQDFSLLAPTSNSENINFHLRLTWKSTKNTRAFSPLGGPMCPHKKKKKKQRTPGLTAIYLLSRQGKHVGLIARQLPMKTSWWDAPLALRDLAKNSLHVCQNFIFMPSLIYKVDFCLANVFSSKTIGCHYQLVAN